MGSKTQLLISRLKDLDEELDLDQFYVRPERTGKINIMYEGSNNNEIITVLISKGFSVKASFMSVSLVRDDVRVTFSIKF